MQQNILNSAKVNGLIIGCLLSLKFLLSVQNNMLLSFLAMAISVSIIVVLYSTAVKFRDIKCEGSIQFKHAFSFIFQLYFFGTIISSLVMFIYTQFIDKAYLETMMNETLKMYDKMGISMDDQSLSIVDNIFKPAAHALVNVLGGIFGGALWGLILAAFIKKEKSIFEKEL